MVARRKIGKLDLSGMKTPHSPDIELAQMGRAGREFSVHALPKKPEERPAANCR
jgi:hypothetical protein